MKNVLMIACVAVCTVFMSANTSYALGGNGGGGGGKTASSARVAITNTEAVAGTDVAVWIRTVGTRVPSTLGALRSQLIFLAPTDVRNTNNLRNGSYLITTVDVANLVAPDDTPIDQAVVDSAQIDTQSFQINGIDRSVDVSGTGINFRN